MAAQVPAADRRSRRENPSTLNLDTAESLDTDEIADAVESVGFECTDCGDCCTSGESPLAVTVFPDERRVLGDTTGLSPEEATEPSPFSETETFEWTVRRDGCGDCYFYDGAGCSVYSDRPHVCKTYPFRIELDGETGDGDDSIELETGNAELVLDDCEGVGREMPREAAVELARSLKKRVLKEEREAIELIEAYERVEPPEGHVVVHDSEGSHTVKRE